jgi:hypothetical protein
MNRSTLHSGICWDRPRLTVSWLLWLGALVLIFQPSGGFAAMILIVLAGWLRPRSLRVWSDRHLLKAAIALLVVLPLTAVFLGSGSALSFMRTSAGMVLIVILWAFDTALDLPYYRKLQPWK